MRVKSLHIYPVKSGQGIKLQSAELRPRGLAGDRRFMIVDEDGTFITQRQIPKLACLKTGLTRKGLCLSWPGINDIEVGLPSSVRRDVVVWRSTVSAAIAAPRVNDALSAWLGKSVSLVFMDEASVRTANEKWTSGPSPVSFADGYPLLITTTASLAALNQHVIEGGALAVPMTRFRPNIVIDCDTPWAEDNWKQIKIGGVVIDLVKPCTRCIMTTLDQSSGEKQGREPLRSLRALRTSADSNNEGVLFGVNAVPNVLGEISAGMGCHIT